MRKIRNISVGISLILVGLAFALISLQASTSAASASNQDAKGEPIPAFHTSVPNGPLPATLNPALFADPVVQNAYRLASRIRKILYQQPCYCHCDRTEGHGSLLDCYVSHHAAECGVCVQEGLYAYEQSHKGKSAAQIRDGIERGEWRSVELARYGAPLPTK